MLTLVVLAIAAGAIAAMVVLWPNSDDVPKGANPYGGEGVSTVTATVTSVEPFDCNSGGEGPTTRARSWARARTSASA